MKLDWAIRLQEEMASRLFLRWKGGKVRLVGGADCAFDPIGRSIGAAIVIMSIPDFEIVDVAQAVARLSMPYIPGFLSFREGPVYLDAIRRLRVRPDVMLFDGNGIAHPRKMGLASHVGVLLDIPTIGCAKTAFFRFRPPAGNRGSSTSYKNNGGEKVGCCLRTRAAVKPVFVSPGHRVDFAWARKIVLDCSRLRIPEPLREADRLSREIFS
jgi:deoxyribonuclease V